MERSRPGNTWHRLDICYGLLRTKSKLRVHTRRQNAATCRGDTSQRQIRSSVYWKISVKIFVSATGFCRRTKSQILLRNTRRDLSLRRVAQLLLQLVAWPVHTEWSVAATCCSNLSASVYRPLCPDKRSLVCGSGEELAEDPLTLSAMKSPAYAPICCFKIVIRWCCALQTKRRVASLFSTNLKHALSSWNLPQAIFIEKKNEAIFL